jgi:FkbM family methyltransferase
VFVRAALNAGAKTVVASEPSPENLECLRRNFAAEIEAGRVILLNKGVWHQEDTLRIHLSGSPAGDSFVFENKSGQTGPALQVTTIDALVRNLGLPRLDFIKMDIEGAEQNALAGAKETLARWRPRLAISVYHLPEDPARIPEIVRAATQNYTWACQTGKIVYNGLLHSRLVPQVYFFNAAV